MPGQPILQYTAFEDSAGSVRPKRTRSAKTTGWTATCITRWKSAVAAEWNKDLASEDTLTFHQRLASLWIGQRLYDGDFTAYDAVQGDLPISKLDQYSSELLHLPGGKV